MNFLNAAAEATLTDAAALVSSGKGGFISIAEALSLSVTGIAVVMIILALLAVLVVILSKVIRTVESVSKKKAKSKDKSEAEVKLPVAEKKAENKTVALDETQSAGKLDLYKTDEKTAAVIMAIVSNESGIPLNKLQFNSIKLIEK